MKVLTAAEMREVDRRTIELGIPGIVLMENAGHRVVELMQRELAPLDAHRIVVLCGRGNNGGDGMVIARQLCTRIHPRALHVVLASEDLKGEALENLRMLRAVGCPVTGEITAEMRNATLVVDALLGTGLKDQATGLMADWIHEINNGFPLAKVVAVDIPSGLNSDLPASVGPVARADYTVTFTAPKIAQVLPPNCTRVGRLVVCPIGSPPELYDGVRLETVEARSVAPLFAARMATSHKGDFGHVLVIGGSRGKTGAAAMCGMAALRAGAGLVTVASAKSAVPVIAAHAAEIMTEPLPETDAGTVSLRSFDYGRLARIAEAKDIIALGPGLGAEIDTVHFVQRIASEFPHPMIVDADGLNALAGTKYRSCGRMRVFTPHPGEMARLTGRSTAEVQADRVGVARAFAAERGVVVVLKGYRTVIAFPDGRVWINTTGTPAMATGGTGDILTGLLAGFLAQFPDEPERAIAAAVHLHGLAGELGAAEMTEKALIATDLLRFLPAAIDALSHQL